MQMKGATVIQATVIVTVQDFLKEILAALAFSIVCSVSRE